MISSWSFSSLMDYEACPHRAWHKSINKSPRPKFEKNRGTEIHEQIEKYLANEGELPDIHPKSAENIKQIKQDSASSYSSGIEAPWGLNRNWQPTPYDEAWLKAKTDYYQEGDTTIYIEDWKSGKLEGNEIKHIMQGQLYTCVAAAIFPTKSKFQVSFHYLDLGLTKSNEYNREQTTKWKPKWHQRASIMTNAMVFPPKASKSSCRFCLFGPQGSNVCEYGIPQ